MSRRSLYCFGLLWLLGLLVLSGCQGAAPTQPAFVPIRPDPTGTPTRASGGPTPQRAPTSVISDQVTINHYTHPSNRFRIDYPENWQPFERPDGIIFINPDSYAGYSVHFSDVGQTYSAQELNQYLVSFVAKNFVGTDTEFKAISQEQKEDGSVVAQFSSVDANLGRTVSEVRVWQQGTVVFVLLINAVEEQWEISQHKLQALADTFTPLETKAGAAPTPTAEIPEWVLIGPANNEFGFFYPSNWEVLRQDENSAAVGLPEEDLVFEVSVEPWTGAEDDIEAAKKAAQAYLDSLAKDYKHIQNLSPQEFPLDTASGATIDFLYSTKEGTEMAGSIIIATKNGKMYQVVFRSPATLYQAALQWFNPMYKSFRMLSPEEMITPEP